MWFWGPSHHKMWSTPTDVETGLVSCLALANRMKHKWHVPVPSLGLNIYTSTLAPLFCQENNPRMACWRMRGYVDHSQALSPQICQWAQLRSAKLSALRVSTDLLLTLSAWASPQWAQISRTAQPTIIMLAKIHVYYCISLKFFGGSLRRIIVEITDPSVKMHQQKWREHT